MEWVRDNIAAFGGDPNQVTLHGQSAGAIGIGFLLVVPESKDLYKRVIMESYAVIQGNSEPSVIIVAFCGCLLFLYIFYNNFFLFFLCVFFCILFIYFIFIFIFGKCK